jgi:GR25 family glycosyltransferase involved in LPS biosynthesis
MDCVYIVHYLPNTDRKAYIIQSNIFENFPVVWNTSYQTVDSLPPIHRRITDKELCVYLAHKEILEDVVAKKYKSFLILEDDALINDFEDFSSFIKNVNTEFLNSDNDMLFAAEAPPEWNLKVNNPNPEQLIYSDVIQCSLASHCYSIKVDKIPQILENFKYDLPIDHEFNRLINVLGLKVAWSHPGVRQGTHTHMFKSNLR